MAFSYQDINEAMARGKRSYSKELVTEIKKVNTYLTTGVGEEPEWLAAFLNSNKEKMLETVYRATMDEGIVTLLGYNEGYFCEIVQNANDLHCGNIITISTSKKDTEYELKCKYEDTGFEVSNIYSFLNREMSDKISEEDQTGKLGIGIKSFFKFVDELSITSNVNIRFTIDRNHDEGILVKGNVGRNKHWNNNHTVLGFKYDANQKTGFNTRKLSKLVDYLCEDGSEDLEQMFFYGNVNELIFDIRSLMFMGMKDKKQSISKIDFRGSKHKVSIKCDYDESEQMTYEECDWKVKTALLSIIIDGYKAYSYEFLMFQNQNFAFAFPLGDELVSHNRYYATYFLKEDCDDNIYPASTLIHSKYANMYRTDLGEGSLKINRAYEDIKMNLLKLYEFMCSKEIGESIFKVSVSDIFHSLLYCYLNVSKDLYKESPLNIESVTTRYLPKTSKVSELNGDLKSYVVRHKEVEAYETSAYAEGDISEELTKIYIDNIEANEVMDYYSLINNHQCISGVKRLYQAVVEDVCDDENRLVILDIMNLFLDVKNYIVYKISKVKPLGIKAADAQIDRWLNKCKESMKEVYKEDMLLKLVGRYGISDAVTYNGNVIGRNLSFKDYIFSGAKKAGDGTMVKLQNREFDNKYKILKEELLQKRITDEGNIDNIYSVRCIQADLRLEEKQEIVFKSYATLSRQSTNRKEFSKPLLLLERLAKDEELLKYVVTVNQGYHMYLFQKKVGRFLYGNDNFTHSLEFEQQIIDIGCMRNIKFDDFSDFIQALDYRARIDNEELRECIKLVYVGNNLNTSDVIEKFLPQIIKVDDNDEAEILKGYEFENLKINNIVENTNNEYVIENRKFVKALTGYDIHLYRYDSRCDKKVLAFCCGNKFKVRVGDDEQFEDIARYVGKKKEVFLFYDNYNKEVFETVAIVLKQLGIRNKTLQLMKGYIHNKNVVKGLDYTAYMRSIVDVKRKLVFDWYDVKDIQMESIYDNEVLYRILTARGSYDIFCPICADVSIENVDFSENGNNEHNRHIVILENENKKTKDEFPYIVTVCCTSCFERLKSTLCGSEFDGKTLMISTQIIHGQYEKLIHKKYIELSPVNIEVMKHLKLISF